MNEKQSTWPPAPATRVRASDAERDAVATQLAEHLVVGRLTTEEYEQRLDELYASRYIDELDLLLQELPLSAPTSPLGSRRASARLSDARSAATTLVVASGASGLVSWWSSQGGGNKELLGLVHPAPVPIALATWLMLLAAVRQRRQLRRPHTTELRLPPLAGSRWSGGQARS